MITGATATGLGAGAAGRISGVDGAGVGAAGMIGVTVTGELSGTTIGAALGAAIEAAGGGAGRLTR
ncbi:hypothetical protein LDC_3017 [sediment metagenome]|uniref:Uncharacterized protein n=1 Tax=sediment metagenome TaxID=749907 RepID=D9PN88_9ZZZZ